MAPNPRSRTRLEGDLARERRCRARLGHTPAEDVRYDERTSSERVNADLKDRHGGQAMRVRGNAKVMGHLMFGIATIAAVPILRLVT